MTYNRSKIMKQAWSQAKAAIASPGYARHQLCELFAQFLRMAWAVAKKAARFAKMTAEEIGYLILSLECKDRLNHSDFQELSELRSFQCTARDRETIAAKLAA